MRLKKNLSMALAALLCLMLPLSALATGAEEDAAPAADKWAKGTVRTSETVDVFAPVGGQLKPLDLAVGDDIQAGQPLVEVRPGDVLAPYDGVVRIQHAQVGDIAQSVSAMYGALCYIEREDVAWLRTSTSTAYNDAENRDIRVGETLRVYNGKSYDKKEAVGRVVSVSGTDFVVEFPAGVFDAEDDIRAYRGSGSDYKDADIVGRGQAERVPPIAVTGEGVVAGILIGEGDTVERGQALYILDSETARYDAQVNTAVDAAQDGVLTALYVQSGQQVIKDQLLMTITPLTDLECVVEVDELDILALSVGGEVRVKFDAMPSEEYHATITRIKPIGTEMLDTTKYEMTLRLTADIAGLLPGMHVTAYWQ